jgi:hypothetical protein
VTPRQLHAASRCGLCGQTLFPTDAACLSHGHACPALQGLRISRHNRIRDILADFLRRVGGAHSVQVEPDLGAARPDIRVTIGLRTFYIDVSVVNPAAQSYVLAAAEADEAAATQRAHEKRLRYSDALAARGIDANALVPFVFETSGRLGPDARAFLDSMKGLLESTSPSSDASGTLNFFVDRMRHALLEANGLLVHHAWSRLLLLQPPTVTPHGGTALGGPE